MLEVTPNNNQPTEEKKSFGKFGIFLVIFAFLCIAGLLYYYVPKILAPDSAKNLATPEKTDEEKIKEGLELVRQGYSRSISGRIKEINENKIIISVNEADNEEKNYTVYCYDKTKISKIVYDSQEIEINQEIEGNYLPENKFVEIKISDLEKGDFVNIILTKFVILDKENNLVAKEMFINERTQENEIQDENMQEDNNVEITDDTK